MGRVAELAELEQRLKRLRRDYLEHAALEPLTDTNKRFAVHQSLIAVIEFMRVQPDWRGLDFALLDMATALADIEYGRSVEWLSNPLPHRAPIPIKIAVLRGRLAGFMELLISEENYTRQDAAQYVLDRLPPDSPLLTGKRADGINWNTVARWRDKVIGRAEPSPEREGYEAMLALANRLG